MQLDVVFWIFQKIEINLCVFWTFHLVQVEAHVFLEADVFLEQAR